MNLVEYIKRGTRYIKGVPKQMKGGVEIYVDDPLPDGISVNDFIKTAERALPSHFFKHIDSIHIGEYDFLLRNNMKSYYKNGKIFISAADTTLPHLLFDLFHEVAHSLEKPYNEFIYGDGALEKEFLNKRITFERFMNVYFPETKKYSFNNTEYNKEFDELLHKRIGYDKLRNFTDSIFVSPYAATSLREYFASGLESYIEGNREELDRLCPVLYNKIKLLYNSE